MNWKRLIIAIVILVLYLAAAATLVILSYRLFPSTGADAYKEFGVRAAIALTALGALFGLIMAFFTLDTQITAAKKLEGYKGDILVEVEKRKNELQVKLEDHKAEILLSVEARKNELLGQIETLKGNIDRYNTFVSRALETQSDAYEKLSVASTNCYRELEKLLIGQYNKKQVAEYQKTLTEAEGLAADLGKEIEEIFFDIQQAVFNIVDKADEVHGSDDEKKKEYAKIWHEELPKFADAIIRLRARSLFRDQSVKIDPPA